MPPLWQLLAVVLGCVAAITRFRGDMGELPAGRFPNRPHIHKHLKC